MRYEDAPLWLKAADTHNVAAHGESMFSNTFEWVGEKITNAPKAAVTASMSAAASFVNTGIAFANLFRPEEAQAAYADVGDWAAALDSDLGRYYEENKGFVDTVGFIGGSFIPGLGGVKLLGAGQKMLTAASAGQVGTNMSRATGLLVPRGQIQVQRHAAELAARNETWKVWQGGALKSIRDGAHQGILEGIAFEGMVMVTMNQAPMFDDMTTGDMIKNMGIGIALGGGLGLAVGAAHSYFGVNALLRNADARRLALSEKATPLRDAPNLDSLSEGEKTLGFRPTPEADTITAAAYDRQQVAREVTPEDVLAMKLAAKETGYSISPEAIAAEVKFLNTQRERNLSKINNDIRRGIRGLEKSPAAKKDLSFGNMVADVFQGLEDQGMYNAFSRMRQYVRPAEESVYDKAVKQYAKEAKISREAAATALGPDTSKYIRLHSGRFGDVLEELPANSLRLADQMVPGEIASAVKKAGFTHKKSVPVIGKTKTGKLADLSQATINKAEARWIWARGLKETAKIATAIDAHDLPLLKVAIDRGVGEVLVKLPNGELVSYKSSAELVERYKRSQMELLNEMTEAGANPYQIEIVTDLRADYVQGAPRKSPSDPTNFSAQESYASEINEFLGSTLSPAELHNYPRFMKASYAQEIADGEGNVLRGMQAIKYAQHVYQEAADRAVAAVLPAGSDALIPYTEESLRRMWRGGSGQSFIGNAGGQYGSFEAITSANATVVAKLEREFIGDLKGRLEGASQLLLSDSTTAIRFSTINEIISGQVEKFVLSADGTNLIPRKLRDWEQAIEAGENVPAPKLHPGTPDSIPLEDDNIRRVVRDHIAATAKRDSGFNTIYAAQGNESLRYSDTFYPVRQDPRQFKHVAFVVDPTISGVGHKRMVLARNSDELEQQLSLVPKEYKVVRTTDSKDFHDAVGDWNYDKSLHENYLDTDLTSRGVRSNFFPMTDPQLIADTFMQHHIRQETSLFKESIKTKFAPAIQEMERRGALYAGTHESATDHISKLEVSSRKNPYMAQVKSLLNQSRVEDIPQWWLTTQQSVDRAISSVWNRATDVFRESKLTTQDKIDQANAIFEEAGFKTAYWGAAEQILANTRLPTGVVSNFLRTSNAFLANTVLRWDPFNALNNILGNQVMMVPEMQKLIQGIRQGSAEGAGDLAKLADIVVPGSEGASILAPQKLIAKAYKDLYGEGNEAVWRELRDHGIIPDLMDQHRQGMDQLVLRGTETVKDMNSKTEKLKGTLKEWGNTLAKATGNEIAERVNRAASAMVMKNITDLAVREGILDQKEAWAYINMFVNRVNGTVRAAERPLMFQGPIGQAMGLFQSYQMNMMQQAFRHIGEGRGKTLALMAGMQTSIYGANTLPGFDLINHSLIGTAAGNPAHQDLHSLSYSIFGETGANWLMYGAPSNILNASLYTRGNTNPRVWHVVPNPTNPSEIPAISAYAQAIGSIRQATSAVAEGAPIWESFLSGVEHLGLSRPLAGLAASARAFSSPTLTAHTTQRSGNFLYENDLLSLTTLTRLAGAKPLDEARMQNMYFSSQAYDTYDREQRNKLGVAVRASIRSGGVPSNEAIADFAAAYAGKGGSQTGFNSYFMNQYRNATQSQADQLASRLTTPGGRRMQYLLGGSESLDELQ